MTGSTAAITYLLAINEEETHWYCWLFERALCILLGAVVTSNPNLLILTSKSCRNTLFTFGLVGERRFWIHSMGMGRSLVSATITAETYG